MDQSQFLFWQKWLTWANVFAMLMGFLVAFAGNSLIFYMHNEATRQLFLGGAEFSPDILRLKNWLFGIIGATIAGFHILMVMISENAFKKKERWAYLAMWYGLLTWFLIDSAISAYYGAILNILMINVFTLFLIGLPLLMTRKAFV